MVEVLDQGGDMIDTTLNRLLTLVESIQKSYTRLQKQYDKLQKDHWETLKQLDTAQEMMK